MKAREYFEPKSIVVETPPLKSDHVPSNDFEITKTKKQQTLLKKRYQRNIFKRLILFFFGLALFGFFVSSAIYQNLIVDIDGEQVKVKDVIQDFFKSQAYQQFRSILGELWVFYLKHGLTGIWKEMWTAFDFESDKQAFEVLNLRTDASQKDIIIQCKTLARKWHPDRFRNPDAKREAEVTFINIQQACNRLSAERKKETMDK